MTEGPDLTDGSVGWKLLSLLPCTTELEREDPDKANNIYERVLRENAGSYKIWHAYLQHRVRQLDKVPQYDAAFEDVNNCFERGLVFMHKMPRIWMEYCELLIRQKLVTRTRRTLNRALEALPITQHARIWPIYMSFIKEDHVPVETAVRVFKRYMQIQPEDAEDFIDYLNSNGRYDEAAHLLCDIINDSNFHSKNGKTKYHLWEELCDMICERADQIESINAEAILRDGIQRYQDQQGRLFNALARYYIQLGLFASARNVYDEAIHQVTTKKDFAEVWEAYTNFEEKYLERLIEQDGLSKDQIIEVELRQYQLEELITNSGLLLNRVALRQNPHNIKEWQKRVKLYEQFPDSHHKIEETYLEAIRTIDPKQSLGKYEDLWIEYATFHATSNRLEMARDVFERAIKLESCKTESLAKIWCSYIEFEACMNNDKALRLAKKATSTIKNLRLWTLHADLEEISGNHATTKAVYDRILDLKIATPQIILNYARYLESKNYFEDSFRVFERGTSIFKWPASFNIWHTYISKFWSRYGHKKLDRARDILDQCLKDCPSQYAFEFYVLYSKLEEEHGFLKHAHSTYSNGIDRLDGQRKIDLFEVYLKSMMSLINVDGLRQIYEKAIATLDNHAARKFCLGYADFEEGLDEIDRARAIYSYCSQLCNPFSDREFWNAWATFEQKHGALDTIDEMLRIKRSVELLYPRSIKTTFTT